MLTLIGVEHKQNTFGVWEDKPMRKDVFCQVGSVSRSEFFEAGRNGLNPELVFSMFAGDYDGERVCEFRGDRYSIYRTYLGRNDTLELYVERKGGTNGKDTA